MVAGLGFSAPGQDSNSKEDPVTIFNQAQDLHEKGDFAGAIKFYEMALRIEPTFPEAEFQCGLAQLSLGKKAEAEKAFRKAIELRPEWALPLTSLGSLLMDKGETAEADKFLSMAANLEPNNAAALTALTQLRINSKAAAPVLESLLASVTALTGKANATASLWSSRAALENTLHKRGAAKSSAGRALTLDPQNRSAPLLLIEIAIEEGDSPRAWDILSRLESTGQPTDETKLYRALLLASDGKADESLAQLALIEKPSQASIELRNRINISRTANTVDLEKELEKNTTDPFVLGRLCSLLRRENPEKALGYCRRASEAEPGNVNHAVGFGAALVQNKQYDLAVSILRKIIQIVPDNFTAHANLATALFQVKRFPEARAEFEWLTNAQPKSPGAYYFLGILNDEAGEYIDALANYQAYLRLADPFGNKDDIDRINLRLPLLQKAIKAGKKKGS